MEVRGACLLPTAPVASPTEPFVPSTGQNADASRRRQFRAHGKRSPDRSQSPSANKVSLQSVGSQSSAAAKTKKKERLSQKQHVMDLTGSRVKRDRHSLVHGTFLLPLRIIES